MFPLCACTILVRHVCLTWVIIQACRVSGSCQPHATFLPRRFWSPSLSVNSEAVMALGRSCLLANTRRVASLSSSSCSWNIEQMIPVSASKSQKTMSFVLTIFCNSSLASLIRSRSLLSTTKINPCVFWNFISKVDSKIRTPNPKLYIHCEFKCIRPGNSGAREA